MFLIDTMVLSDLHQPSRRPTAANWIRQIPSADIFISVITIGEIERGIERQRSLDPPFARRLAAWLSETLDRHGEKVLSVDTPIARRWGQLAASLGYSNNDLLIAATALEHGLTMVTRNVRHFEPTGVPVINPYAG